MIPNLFVPGLTSIIAPAFVLPSMGGPDPAKRWSQYDGSHDGTWSEIIAQDVLSARGWIVDVRIFHNGGDA